MLFLSVCWGTQLIQGALLISKIRKNIIFQELRYRNYRLWRFSALVNLFRERAHAVFSKRVRISARYAPRPNGPSYS